MYDRHADATLCVRCANLIVPDGTRAAWWRWCCAAAKQDPLFNPLTGKMDGLEPYKRCRNLNGGDCVDYQPGPNSLHPKATENGEVI